MGVDISILSKHIGADKAKEIAELVKNMSPDDMSDDNEKKPEPEEKEKPDEPTPGGDDEDGEKPDEPTPGGDDEDGEDKDKDNDQRNKDRKKSKPGEEKKEIKSNIKELTDEEIENIVNEVTNEWENEEEIEDLIDDDEMDFDLEDDLEGGKENDADSFDWESIKTEEIAPDLPPDVLDDLCSELGYRKMFKILSKLIESRILRTITVPSHAEPTEEVERDSEIGLRMGKQEKWDIVKSISSWGGLYPSTTMGKTKTEKIVKKGPMIPKTAEYALIMDGTGSMRAKRNYGGGNTADSWDINSSQFVSGFITYLVLEEARIHGDRVSFYMDSNRHMGTYGMKGSDGDFDMDWEGRNPDDIIKKAEQYRYPATTNYDGLWEWFIRQECCGGAAVTLMPYFMLSRDAQSFSVASPLNLIVMGDFDDIEEEESRQIGKFLDFFEKKFGDINLTVIVIDKNPEMRKFKWVEKPRSEGGLGGVLINLPYGSEQEKPFNPQIVFDKIKNAVFHKNSPIKRMKFKSRA